MPELKWNETDFIECLEVIPEVEYYEVKHTYKIKKNGLVLTVIVWQFESVICLSITQQEIIAPISEFVLFVRESVEYIKDKRGEYLEFQDCIIAPSRFSYLEMGNVFDTDRFNYGIKVEVAIKPQLQIRYVRN